MQSQGGSDINISLNLQRSQSRGGQRAGYNTGNQN